jgi:hypothetical protein
MSVSAPCWRRGTARKSPPSAERFAESLRGSPKLDVRQYGLVGVTQIQNSTNIRFVRANAHAAGIGPVVCRIGGYATRIAGRERRGRRATLIDDQRLRRPKLIGDLEPRQCHVRAPGVVKYANSSRLRQAAKETSRSQELRGAGGGVYANQTRNRSKSGDDRIAHSQFLPFVGLTPCFERKQADDHAASRKSQIKIEQMTIRAMRI